MSYSLENARFQWEEGWRRVREGADDPARRRALDRISIVIREELRRRLGAGFTAEQLAEAYGAGTDWCLDLAYEIGEGIDDPSDAVDAAFWEQLRFARDFAGGVTREINEPGEQQRPPGY